MIFRSSPLESGENYRAHARTQVGSRGRLRSTRAWHDRQHVYIDLMLPRAAADCRPASVHVSASSTADGSNQALTAAQRVLHVS